MVGTKPMVLPRPLALSEYACISLGSLIIRIFYEGYLMTQKRAIAQSTTARITAKALIPRFLVKKSLSILALLFVFGFFFARSRSLPGGKITFWIIGAAVEQPSAPGPALNNVTAALGAFGVDFF